METEKKLQVKKGWTKPELLVLVRHNPEEAVLTGCKETLTSGPDVSNGNCSSITGCALCEGLGTS